jgi:hypothetical protein
VFPCRLSAAVFTSVVAHRLNLLFTRRNSAQSWAFVPHERIANSLAAAIADQNAHCGGIGLRTGRFPRPASGGGSGVPTCSNAWRSNSNTTRENRAHAAAWRSRAQCPTGIVKRYAQPTRWGHHPSQRHRSRDAEVTSSGREDAGHPTSGKSREPIQHPTQVTSAVASAFLDAQATSPALSFAPRSMAHSRRTLSGLLLASERVQGSTLLGLDFLAAGIRHLRHSGPPQIGLTLN